MLDTIVLVFEGTKYAGLVTYGICIGGDQTPELQTETIEATDQIFEDARKMFSECEYIKYLPVVDGNGDLMDFCYEDENLEDIELEVESMIENHDQLIRIGWRLEALQAVNPMFSCICLRGFSELSYAIYVYACTYGIPVFADGARWENLVGVSFLCR